MYFLYHLNVLHYFKTPLSPITWFYIIDSFLFPSHYYTYIMIGTYENVSSDNNNLPDPWSLIYSDTVDISRTI